MTREEIETTDWAKRFKKDAPVSYEEGIQFALIPDLPVIIYKTDETGEKVWAVIVDDEHDAFWMDALPTKKEAVALCRKMGWKIV